MIMPEIGRQVVVETYEAYYHIAGECGSMIES